MGTPHSDVWRLLQKGKQRLLMSSETHASILIFQKVYQNINNKKSHPNWKSIFTVGLKIWMKNWKIMLVKHLVKHIRFSHSHRSKSESAPEPPSTRLVCFIRLDMVRAAPLSMIVTLSLIMYDLLKLWSAETSCWPQTRPPWLWPHDGSNVKSRWLANRFMTYRLRWETKTRFTLVHFNLSVFLDLTGKQGLPCLSWLNVTGLKVQAQI